MTHDYNVIELDYDAIFYKENQYIFSNQADFIKSIENFTNLLERLNNDKRACQDFNIGLIRSMTVNSETFQDVLDKLQHGSPERTFLDAFISRLQGSYAKLSGWKIITSSNGTLTLARHQCVVAISHSNPSHSLSGTQLITTSDALDNFKNNYISEFWTNSKKIGKFIERKFPDDIERFDWKDSQEHSKFPHLHFRDIKPYHGVALFMIDKHFPDDVLLKHKEHHKKVELHRKILKILDEKGFKT